MKEKALQAIKTKFATLGFTDKAFDGAANFLVATGVTEANLETAGAGLEPLLKSFQGDEDSRVGKLLKENEELKAKIVDPNNPPTPPTPPTPPPGETPEQKMQRELFEKLNTTLGSLGERLTKIETGGVVTSRQTQIETALKDAPEAYKVAVLGTFDPASFKDDTAFNDWKTKVTTTNLELFNTKMGEAGISNITAPTISAVAGDSKTTTFKDNLKAAVDHAVAVKEAAKTT